MVAFRKSYSGIAILLSADEFEDITVVFLSIIVEAFTYGVSGSDIAAVEFYVWFA